MFGKFGSLLSFKGHFIGRLGATPKRRQPGGFTMQSVGASSEALECRTLMTIAPGVDVNVTQASGDQINTQIAVNPLNPDEIVIVGDGGAFGPSDLGFYISEDGGVSWTQKALGFAQDGVGTPGDVRKEGSVVFDGYGNIHVAYVIKNVAAVYAFSGDGGDSFATQFFFDDGNLPRPRVTVGPSSPASTIDDQVWMVYERESQSGEALPYLFAYAVNTGPIFGPGIPPVLSTQSDPFSKTFVDYFAVPAIDPNGGLSIVRQSTGSGINFNLNQSVGNVVLNRDSNGVVNGVTMGPDRTVVSTNSGIFESYAADSAQSAWFGSSAQIAYDRSNGPNRGRLYLVYVTEAVDEFDNSDIFLKFSDNNGTTWSPPIRINDDVGSSTQFLPSLSVDPVLGLVVVGWYDARNDTAGGGIDTNNVSNDEVQYFISSSNDGGVTFAPNVVVSDGASRRARDFGGANEAFGAHTGVAAYDGDAYVTWADNSNSTGDNPNLYQFTQLGSRFDIYFDRVSIDPNLPPTISAVQNVAIAESTATGPIDFTVDDSRTPAAQLTVTATSSDPFLVPSDHLILSGSGTNRQISVTPLPERSGTTTITLTVSDGRFTTSTTFDVLVLPTPDPLPPPPEGIMSTTVFDQPTSTPLIDNGTLTSTLVVSGLNTYLLDADVTINISHTRSSDLNVVLISPTGTRVVLTSGNGGDNADVFGINGSAGTLFDDQAISTPVTDYAFQDGIPATYLVPEGALGQLIGEDPNGTWTLEVTDTLTGQTGTLNDWGLSLTTVSVVPRIVTFPTGTNSDLTPIPDTGTPLYSTINFNGLDSYTFDVKLHVNITHPSSGDLDMYLVSPNGTEIAMSTGNGGALSNVFQNPTTFSDSALIPVTDATFVDDTSVDLVIPEAAMAGFLGENPNGDWTLKIVDHSANGLSGSLVDWGLDITTVFVNDLPTMVTILNPGAVPEDSPTQTVDLNSISAGGGETQPMKITATSNNPALIPDLVANYQSPNSTGTVSYTPAPNQFGIAVVTVRIEDGGFDGNLLTLNDNAFSTKQFTVVVNPINDPPTIDPILDPAPILEDSPLQTLQLTGLSAGAAENQPLQIAVTSDHPDIIPNPNVEYSNGATTALLRYKSNLDYNGTVIMTVKITDGGLDGNLATTDDNLTVTETFVVQVIDVNDAPTLDAIPDPLPITEDAPPQTVGLSGITAGGHETQPLRISAMSSNTDLVPNLSINYTSANSVGSLVFRAAPNAFGTALITVTVEDGGPDSDFSTAGDNQTFSQQFTVTILDVNDPPVFDSPGIITPVSEDAGPQSINLTGISAGPFESQPLVFTVTSSNPALVPNPVITYTSPGDTGTLDYSITPNLSGGTVLTVTLMDGGQDGDLGTLDDNQFFSRSIIVTVLAVNDLPTLDDIPNPTALTEDAPLSTTINLAGITSGTNETQPLRVTATSNLPAIISNPIVTYTSGDPTGSLTFQPNPNQFGTVTISVSVTDGGLDGNLATTLDNGVTTKTFTVVVNPVNDPPHFDTIADPTPIDQDTPGVKTVNITGITAGSNENQSLILTAQSRDPSVLDDPTVSFVSGSSTATLSYQLKPGKSGTVFIDVTLTDPGLDNDFVDDADNLTYTQTFKVVINAVNHTPTITALGGSVTLNEDANTQTVNLSGMTPGAGDGNQNFTVTASSSNPSLIPTPAVQHATGSATGTLTYQPASNQPGGIQLSGTSTITVTVMDGGGDNNLATLGDNLSTSTSFVVTVNAVNDLPTIDTLTALNIDENADEQIVQLSGITAGGGETQPVSVTVQSLNTSLIADPSISYTSPSTGGILTFTPLASQSGSAILRITVKDGGLNRTLGDGDDGITVQDLIVNVAPFDDLPTIDPISSPVNIDQNSGPTTITLTGISGGPGESQSFTVSAVSDNTDLISDPVVIFVDGVPTASLTFVPNAGQFGTANITVTVEDVGGNQTARVLTVNVNPANGTPTIDSLGGPVTIDEDAPQQTVNLTGLSAGVNEQDQVFEVRVSSNHPEIIPNPALVYTPGAATGSFHYQPATDANGQAVLTVTVTDGGADNNLATTGDNRSTTVSLTVNVTAQPETPAVTLDEGTLFSTSGRPVNVSSQAQLTDTDSPNFKNGVVNFTITDGAQSGDQLRLQAFGSGSSKIRALANGQLKQGKTVIGSVTGGRGGVPLVITFTADVDQESVRQILRHVQFRGQGSQTGLRTVQVRVTDDTGRTSVAKTRVVALN
ncbi:MAG: hypothetical protein JWN70_4216 [Planctomycetaceae bacterium]|nr:hypothetical protein [Planctomycetaceae bacterium]